MTYYVLTDRDKLIGCLPEDAIGAEVGVFAGDFSATILAAANPRELHLIDAWKFVAYDWNSPGPHVPASQAESFRRYLRAAAPDWNTDDPSDGMAMLYDRVRHRFEGDSRVRIARGVSADVLKSYPDGFFDFLYIDADHDFHPVLSDLWLAKRTLKTGGLIFGHDFDMDRRNGWSNHNVIEAVMSFCKQSGFWLLAVSSDLGGTYVLGEGPPSPFATEFLKAMIGLQAPVIEIPQEIVWNYKRTFLRLADGRISMISSFRA